MLPSENYLLLPQVRFSSFHADSSIHSGDTGPLGTRTGGATVVVAVSKIDWVGLFSIIDSGILCMDI